MHKQEYSITESPESKIWQVRFIAASVVEEDEQASSVPEAGATEEQRPTGATTVDIAASRWYAEVQQQPGGSGRVAARLLELPQMGAKPLPPALDVSAGAFRTDH